MHPMAAEGAAPGEEVSAACAALKCAQHSNCPVVGWLPPRFGREGGHENDVSNSIDDQDHDTSGWILTHNRGLGVPHSESSASSHCPPTIRYFRSI